MFKAEGSSFRHTLIHLVKLEPGLPLTELGNLCEP